MQGNLLTAEYVKIRSVLKGEQALRAAIEWYTAPVIYGCKPSVLINLGKSDAGELACLWEKHHKGLRDTYNKLPVHFHLFLGYNHNLQLFCYIQERMNHILSNDEVGSFLHGEGYPYRDFDNLIQNFHEEFRSSCPHEIGIFLGYPLDDVKGFIKNKGKNYLINGYWKVYSDIPYAIQQFAKYNKAKGEMLKRWKEANAVDSVVLQ
jgi:hypothetical protein